MQQIDIGNENGLWKDKNSNPYKLPKLQLLRDSKNRWSSMYAMLDRFLRLHPVSFCTD
jgi:hypothetical protein